MTAVIPLRGFGFCSHLTLSDASVRVLTEKMQQVILICRSNMKVVLC